MMDKEKMYLFEQAYALINKYRHYLLSETFTLVHYHGNCRRLPVGMVGACVRKLMLAVNQSMIEKGVLPCRKDCSFLKLPIGDALYEDENMLLQECMNKQLCGIMEALGWEFDEYDFSSYMFENSLGEFKECFSEQGMDAEFSEFLLKRGLFDNMISYIPGEGKLVVYTNDKLSKYLLENTSVAYEDTMNLAAYFTNFNIYNTAEESLLWYKDRLYFICLSPVLYAEESDRWADTGDYYLDFMAPYVAVELDCKISGDKSIC